MTVMTDTNDSNDSSEIVMTDKSFCKFSEIVSYIY